MRFFFAVSAVGLLVAAAAGAAVAYDGSYLLFRMLEGHWFWIEHGRLTHPWAQLAPLVASQWTHNLPFLSFLLGVGYASIPLAALALSWAIVRNRAPELFVWSALGAEFIALPGLFCLVSDTMLVEQLAWPLFLGALVGVPRRLVPWVLVVSVIVGASHPVAFILLAAASLLAWIASRSSPDNRDHHRRWAFIFLALSIAALARILIGIDDYERQTFSAISIEATWPAAILGSPLRFILLAWTAGLFVFGERRLRARDGLPRPVRWLVRGAAIATFGLAAVDLVLWALNPKAWPGAIGYRLYLGFAMAPFILAALAERSSQWSGLSPQPHSRAAYLNAIAVVCAAVLVAQSWSWHTMTARLRLTMSMATAHCLSFDGPEMRWARDTALGHWAISTYSLIVQGDRPGAIVLPDGLCGMNDPSNGLYLTSWYTGGWNTRWFYMDRLRPPFLSATSAPPASQTRNKSR